MTKFNVGDWVKDVSNSAPSNPYGIIAGINEHGDLGINWEGSDGWETGYYHPASDFILVKSSTTEIEPWNLMQVSIHNKDKFKETLLNILNEGRKLTPMEVVKVEDFLGVV